MEELLFIVNQPAVLWSIFTAAILAILIDYLFPVDWLAFVGYALFAVFVGATVPFDVVYSVASMLVVFGIMLLLHKLVFANYLTNAPYCYCRDPEEETAS